ncbi:glyoxalase [Salinibacter sp. 10B]|uniref:ring-cleaving dioxygenase n=1 Tax=Salinibacter sp. 10B TaxID=1923971 RepID=UPI000CF5096A|nr:ring-cleaving dioxygenase [Salinibacter sp. 10B]PQJ26796.1 glyoxalase [Salinibacter sp. 10B]
MNTAEPRPTVHGLHHVTAIAGDPQENVDFYTRVLGMRLVKKSVNQDAPDTYHLFYADGVGSPGTDLTFFPWPDLPKARPRAGQIVEVPFAVPQGSLAYWQERLTENDVTIQDEEMRFGERTLPFEDPHGLRLALVETDDDREFEPWTHSPVPAEHQVRGMHAVRLWEHELGPTETLLTEVMGFEKIGEDDDWHRYGVEDSGSGTLAEVKVVDQHPRTSNRVGGTGAVHHAAWRMRDSEEELELRDFIGRVGLQPSPQIDRHWFKSVYFREPGGVLFELATDGPGFTVDEDRENLGTSLVLPPSMEDQREEIEANLPPLDTPQLQA